MPESIKKLGPVDLTISQRDNSTGWSKMNANTSSEPSTLSFNHYMTSCSDRYLNQIDTFLRNTATSLGIDAAAWKIVTDLQILKKANQFHVDTMRCIQLMDAEYNMTNKHVGRQTLAHAEKAKAIAPDQYGSRKNHKCINCVTNKVLLNDLFRHKRIAAAWGMNDARGCYDRIVHSIAILVLMSFGVAGPIARSLIKVLQEADHHMKTGFGRSERVYGNETVPHQGSGQGNGLGPTLWTLISTKLIAMMLAKNHGVQLLSATTVTLICIVCFSFVDDTDLPVAGERHSTGESIAPLFQSALDRWAGGLTVTGGELAPEKLWCYLVDFIWTGTKWRYRSIAEMPAEFTLTDKDGNRHPLVRLEVSEGRKSLGVYIAVDRNEKAQKKYLIEMARTYAEQIRTSQTTPDTAMYTYKACFLKAIEYSMPVTNFTEKEWNTIMAPALKATLNKSAMATNFPRDVLYGPDLYEGMDIQHPYYQQGIQK